MGVVGLGGLGQMGVALAAAMGNTVTAISTSASKQDSARYIPPQIELLILRSSLKVKRCFLYCFHSPPNLGFCYIISTVCITVWICRPLNRTVGRLWARFEPGTSGLEAVDHHTSSLSWQGILVRFFFF